MSHVVRGGYEGQGWGRVLPQGYKVPGIVTPPYKVTNRARD